MKLLEWEIWHTYTSYLVVEKIDLEYAAQRLVESGIAYLSFERDGRTVWRGPEGVGKGLSTIRLNSSGDKADLELTPDDNYDPNIEGFALESWYQACHFRFNELRLFGTEEPLPSTYIRIFLGECNFLQGDDPGQIITVYPSAVLYESGVIIIELRIISPNEAVHLNDFITGVVNLHSVAFDSVLVPPGLSRQASRAWYYSGKKWRLHERAILLHLERLHDLAVTEKTIRSDGSNFKFDLAPLSGSEEPNEYEQLSSLALTTFHTIAYVLGQPRIGGDFLLFGKGEEVQLGGFWTGRPHIHIIRFEGQREKSTENEKDYSSAFGAIIGRVPSVDDKIAKNFLPRDDRVFEDFSAYLSSNASLWVWSLRGLRQEEPWRDPNRGHLIYPNQAKVELLEYVYMLHRALLDRTSRYTDSRQVLRARNHLVELQQEISQASPFGEIRDLLVHGWEAMDLPQIRGRIQEALSIREAQTRLEESRRTQRVGITLSILFGLLTVPPLAEQVLKPAWELLRLPRPDDESFFSLIIIMVSFLLVSTLIVSLLIPLSRLWRKKNTNSTRHFL